MVHDSNIQQGARANSAADLLSRGQQVKVKVMSVAGNRIGLSMKDVDQATGRDLTPHLRITQYSDSLNPHSLNIDTPTFALNPLTELSTDSLTWTRHRSVLFQQPKTARRIRKPPYVHSGHRLISRDRVWDKLEGSLPVTRISRWDVSSFCPCSVFGPLRVTVLIANLNTRPLVVGPVRSLPFSRTRGMKRFSPSFKIRLSSFDLFA